MLFTGIYCTCSASMGAYNSTFERAHSYESEWYLDSINFTLFIPHGKIVRNRGLLPVQVMDFRVYLVYSTRYSKSAHHSFDVICQQQPPTPITHT
jgi:hypothetical protein